MSFVYHTTPHTMKSITLLFLLSFSFTINLVGQSDTLIHTIVGKWYVEKMNKDTIILNKERIAVETKSHYSKVLKIHIYDERVNRIDETIWDGITSQETTKIYVNQHHIHKEQIKFKDFFESSYYFKIGYSEKNRVILCRQERKKYSFD
jgi:hypothetical protein